MFFDTVEPHMCIYIPTYQLGLGRETSKLSPNFVNSHLTQYLDSDERMDGGSKLRYLSLRLRY